MTLQGARCTAEGKRTMMTNSKFTVHYVLPALLLSVMLSWSSAAVAEPGRGRPELSVEPKRSYGAIDVIMYQTSW